MLNQFTNCFLLFILLSFYAATVIHFYIYLLEGEDRNILYKTFAFLWSLLLAPLVCFYGINDLMAVSYEDDNKEQDLEDGEEY